MTEVTAAAHDLVARYDEAWRDLEAEIERLGADALERPTPSGWTAKGMLGHVAFWMETTEPVLVGMLRKELADDEWQKPWFGSGYLAPADGTWPSADVHNARESAWASGQPLPVVLDRLRAAYKQARAALATLREGEDAQHAAWLDGNVDHLREHTAELRAL